MSVSLKVKNLDVVAGYQQYSRQFSDNDVSKTFKCSAVLIWANSVESQASIGVFGGGYH